MAEDSLQSVSGGERFAQEPILTMLPYDAATILVGMLNQGLFLYDGNSFTPFATTANSTGRITFWNKRAEAMFGYSEQEALAQPLTILTPERFREMHRLGTDRFLLTGQPRTIGQVVEIQAVRKDGTSFPNENKINMAYFAGKR